MDHDSLIIAATRHLQYLKKLSANTRIQIGEKSFSRKDLLSSMETFLDILYKNPNKSDLDHAIKEKFTLYQAGGRGRKKEGAMLITGYFEPILDGNLSRTGPYIYPIYKAPDSLLTGHDPETGKQIHLREDEQGHKFPFWTRAEIESENKLTGNELVYLKDPVDAFLLHVQGSGKIRLRDGSLRTIQFAATNGHEYKSIGKLLVEEQKMTCEEATMPAIRQYLEKHPEDRERILHHNPRFVFFRWNTEKEGPNGSLGLSLTAGRSIAVDPKTLPTGMMAYLVSQKPVLDNNGQLVSWEPMERFVLPQDSGAAIKGAGRADMFWGNGHYAEIAAGNMKEEGQLYFLIKKDTQ